jgi:hypothetical protein
MDLNDVLNSHAAIREMLRVEESINHSLADFKNRHTEGVIVVFALVRVARAVLRLYPPAVQDAMTPLLVSYLQGDAQQPGTDAASPLWMPPTSRGN